MSSEPEAEPFVLNSLFTSDDEFMKQLKSSGAANALTLCIMILFWVVRNKCKHSRCSTICCTVEVNDESAEEETDLERNEDRRRIYEKTEKQIPKKVNTAEKCTFLQEVKQTKWSISPAG